MGVLGLQHLPSLVGSACKLALTLFNTLSRPFIDWVQFGNLFQMTCKTLDGVQLPLPAHLTDLEIRRIWNSFPPHLISFTDLCLSASLPPPAARKVGLKSRGFPCDINMGFIKTHNFLKNLTLKTYVPKKHNAIFINEYFSLIKLSS